MNKFNKLPDLPAGMNRLKTLNLLKQSDCQLLVLDSDKPIILVDKRRASKSKGCRSFWLCWNSSKFLRFIHLRYLEILRDFMGFLGILSICRIHLGKLDATRSETGKESQRIFKNPYFRLGVPKDSFGFLGILKVYRLNFGIIIVITCSIAKESRRIFENPYFGPSVSKDSSGFLEILRDS